MRRFSPSVQVRSLRVQLDVLEARLRRKRSRKRRSIADLWGILRGRADSTPEDIEKALLRTVPKDLS